MIKIYKYGEVSSEEIFARVNPTANVEGVVTEIIAEVVKNKDQALKAYSIKFDGVVLDSLEKNFNLGGIFFGEKQSALGGIDCSLQLLRVCLRIALFQQTKASDSKNPITTSYL